MSSDKPKRPGRISHGTAETIRFYAHTWHRRDAFAHQPRNLQRSALARRGWFDWTETDKPVSDDAVAALAAYDFAMLTDDRIRDYYAADAQREAFRKRWNYEPSLSTDLNRQRIAEIMATLETEAADEDRARTVINNARRTMIHAGTFRESCHSHNCTGCTGQTTPRGQAAEHRLDAARAYLTAERAAFTAADAANIVNALEPMLQRMAATALKMMTDRDARIAVLDDEALDRQECTLEDIRLGLTILCDRPCRLHLAEALAAATDVQERHQVLVSAVAAGHAIADMWYLCYAVGTAQAEYQAAITGALA